VEGFLRRLCARANKPVSMVTFCLPREHKTFEAVVVFYVGKHRLYIMAALLALFDPFFT